MKRLRLLIALTGVAVCASAGVAFGGSAHASAASTIVKTAKTSLGTILVTSSGRTLYLSTGDKPPHFACTGGCLSIWPPLKANGALKAEGAAKAADLRTVKGPAGKVVTYNGHPLYTFASDTKSGQATGEGQNGFYAVSPSGGKITKPAKTTTTTTTSSSSTGPYGY
jgi:predicted lipoprotein with Yx(FWY)xxD motif